MDNNEQENCPSLEGLIGGFNDLFRHYEKHCSEILFPKKMNQSISGQFASREELMILFYEFRSKAMDSVKNMLRFCHEYPDQHVALLSEVIDNQKKYKQITMLLQMKAVLNQKIKMYSMRPVRLVLL